MNKLFKHIKLIMRKNILLFKIIISYIIVGAVLLMALSYYLLRSFSDRAIEDVNTISSQLVSQSEKTSDMLLTYTFNHFNDMYNYDAVILNALYGEAFDYKDISSISAKLNRPILTNPLVHSVYIYNASANVIFSTSTTIKSINEFTDFDSQIVNIISNTTSQDMIKVVPRKIYSKINTISKDINVISVLYLRTLPSKQPSAALVVNIDQKALQNLITDRENEKIKDIFIINKEGIIISHPSDNMIGSKISDEMYENLSNTQNGSGAFELKTNGKELNVIYLNSERWGWLFVSVDDKKMIFWRINELKKNIVIVTGAFILLAVLGALVFTRIIYTPLYLLLGKIRRNNRLSSSDNILNEYDYLANTYDELVNHINDLKTIMPVKKNQVLQNILSGEYLNTQDIRDEMKELGINLGMNSHIACILRMDDFSNLINERQHELSLLRFVMANIAHDVFTERFSIETVDPGGDHICIIVNFEEYSDEIISTLKHLIEQSQYYIKNHYKISVTGSIGDIAEDFESIRISYKNAMEASEYRIVYGKSSIISYSDTLKNINQLYEYPYNKEKQILDSLKIGDINKTSKALDDFINHVSQYSYGEIKLSLNQLAVVSAQLAQSVIEDVDKYNLKMNYRDISTHLGNCDTIYGIKEWLMDFYCKFINAAKSRQDNRMDDVVKKIIDYLEISYVNADLSIDMIAKLVGFSTNYVRSIFKEKNNISISDYISRLRFEKACELLKETEYTASRISDMVGFHSSKYFFVAFKKHTGKTPEQFRKDLLLGS